MENDQEQKGNTIIVETGIKYQIVKVTKTISGNEIYKVEKPTFFVLPNPNRRCL